MQDITLQETKKNEMSFSWFTYNYVNKNHKGKHGLKALPKAKPINLT